MIPEQKSTINTMGGRFLHTLRRTPPIIWAIASNTFREAIRNKILYSLVFFAILMIGGSLALGKLSMHEEVRLLKDLGLATISIFGVLIAIFIGVNMVFKEIDRKTIYIIIPKPIHRFHFIIGKYLGIGFTLAIQIIFMAIVLFLLMFMHNSAPDSNMLKAVLMIFVEVMVMSAVATLFSSFSTNYKNYQNKLI